jgi:ribonuclease J
VLRDRRRIAWDGIVVPIVAVDRMRGLVDGYPRIMTRGFIAETEPEEGLLRDAQRVLVDALAEATPEERSDEALLKARIQGELKRYLRRRTQRQPLIVPVIVEL